MAVGITIKELADKIGVSRTTVSRVMAGQAQQYRISGDTAQRVRDAAKLYGLAPNRVAQNLRLQKTDTIGFIIPEISNPFFANLAHIVERELRAVGKMILLCNTNEDTELENDVVSMIVKRQIDGLLMAPVGLEGRHLRKLEDRPIVFIDRYFSELSIPYVTTNNEEGAISATSYLIDRGHKEITCIQGLQETISNQDRISGYQRAMKSHGLKNETDIIGNAFTIDNGYESMVKILSRSKIPSAIFTLNNQIAMGALRAIKEKGLKVPEDISLITFDDQPSFQLMSTPITAVRQPIDQMAREGVRKLVALLEGGQVTSLMISPQIMERESVKRIG